MLPYLSSARSGIMPYAGADRTSEARADNDLEKIYHTI